MKPEGRTSVSRRLATVEDTLNVVGSMFIMLMMFVTVIDITGRGLLNAPLPGAYELAELLMIVLVYFGLARTLRIGGHIKVDSLTMRLPLNVQTVLRDFSYLVAFVVIALVTWEGAAGTMEAFRIGDRTPDIVGWPYGPFKLCLTIGCFLFCIRCIIDIIHTHMGGEVVVKHSEVKA